jgi:hypothetical protein
MVTLAYSMPGGSTSMPNRAVPSSLDAASMRRTGWPRSLKRAGSLSVTLPGSGCLAASAANSPKFALLPEGCNTLPASARHSPGGSFHSSAAAPINSARAEAPASRIGNHKSLMLDEPPVIMTPISRMAFAVSQPATRLRVPSLSGWNGRPSTKVARLL